MAEVPVQTTVIGSHPFPGWLEVATGELERFGPADREELGRDATTAAVMDMVRAGVDVITDGEQGRFDFNLSFYGHLEGLALEGEPPRKLGPPLHDQRGRHRIAGELRAPRGLGVVAEFERLRELAPAGPRLKASVPGPYTLAGRVEPGGGLPDRWAVAEALRPIVSGELAALADAGCERVTLDEPSMSCYAHREDPERLAELFNRTVAPVAGRLRVATHLCFGNFKGRAAAPRRYAPMFPAFTALDADEVHLEMASREGAELELVEQLAAAGKDVAVGVVDVKSGYVETEEDVAERIRAALRHVPAQQLVVAPDCGLSQTARWAAVGKLRALVGGARQVREAL